MTKRYVTSDGCTFSVEKVGYVVEIAAESGYNAGVGALLTLRDTGNGFVSLSHNYLSTEQDHYLTIDYAEAEYLYYAIGEALKLRKQKAKKGV